jgi:GNAT superfamily N-acetyltransferase
MKGRTLLIALPDDAWAEAAKRAYADRAISPGERYAIRKDIDHFDPAKLRAFASALPDRVRLSPIDGTLYREALKSDWSRDFVSLFADEADYLARGLGVIALEDGMPVAGASSCAVFRGGIEIEIDTREDRRRRGLATACGAALMLECFRRGLYPSWDAANRASASLAEKLGYVFDRSYPIVMVDL